jgi:exosortase A-associated hydrolase 1
MDSAMRRLLTISCNGALLGASLDEAAGPVGVLMVTGGTQTRIGSHRMFERLAAGLAAAGYPVLRSDRRGVGDSEGEDGGWRSSANDIAAATAAFRSERPGLERILGFGLCDGATALALYGKRLDRLILANPWLVETEAGEHPAAAVRERYKQRLTSAEGWKKLLVGSVSYRQVLKDIRAIAGASASPLAAEVAGPLSEIPVQFILSRGDATGIAAAAEWEGEAFAPVRAANPAPLTIDTDSHTFARPGDSEALLAACLEALSRG